MDKLTKKRLLWLGAVLISFAALAVALLLCLDYYSSGKNLRPVDVRSYLKVDKNSNGDYLVSVDADRIIKDYYLPDPKSTTLELERYPDVRALYSLAFIQTDQGQEYFLQVGSDLPDASGDLKQGKLYLTHTSFYINREELEAQYRKAMAYPRKLSMKDYLLCTHSPQGGYLMTVDTKELLFDCGWQLPQDETLKQQHKGYEAVMSLGFLVSLIEEGYKLETTSTVASIAQDLADNGIILHDTVWTMSKEEIESLYRAQNP